MKRRTKINKPSAPSNETTRRWHSVGLLVVFIGAAIMIAGGYFLKNDISGSGLTMNRYGDPYGRGSLDGYGLLFCGILIFLFGLMMAAPKRKDQAGK